MKIKGIDHVGVIVNSMDDARGTIGGVLGLEESDRIDLDTVSASFFACAGARVELIEYRAEHDRQSRLGPGGASRIDHIAFAVDDIQEMYDALLSLGVAIQSEPAVVGSIAMFFTDPSAFLGVTLQFVERLPAAR